MRWPSNRQEVYLSMPSPVRQGLIFGVSAYHRMLRYGRVYHDTLALARDADYWTPDLARHHQQKELRRLLLEATQHTRYYRESLAGMAPGEIERIASELDLGALPLLEKSILKARTSEFLNSSRRPVAKSATSGSTGSPLVVRYDRASIEMRMALVHHQRRWLGLAPMPRSLRLSGREIVPAARAEPPYWLWNPFERQLLLSTYHLRPDALPDIARRVREFSPEVIEGYPTAIAQLAAYFGQTEVRLPALAGCITTAETLDPELRREITEGFGAPVLDYYAASEGVPLIQECRDGRYHLRLDSGIFEILGEDGRSAAPGEAGELVVTSFAQWQMPLIRYRTGDVAIAHQEEGACPCGRALPTIAGVLGRVEDLVRTVDGRKIGMFSYRTLKHVPGIREAQIVQRNERSFHVRMVPDGSRGLEDLRQDTIHIFERVLGYTPSVELEQVAEIERGPNGKFRSTVGMPKETRPSA